MRTNLPDYVPDLNKTLCSLNSNHISAMLQPNAEAALKWIKATLTPKSRVAIGGSNTLRNIGVTDYIETGDFLYTSRYVKHAPFKLDSSIPQEVVERSYLDAFTADFYLTSTNAVTEQGELVNVDGLGNRVAAIAYGPKKVIVVVGRNKIVPDMPAAFERLGQIISRGGMGEQRGIETPCRTVGKCIDCKSDNRPCCTYSIVRYQRRPRGHDGARIQVLLIDEDLGF